MYVYNIMHVFVCMRGYFIASSPGFAAARTIIMLQPLTLLTLGCFLHVQSKVTQLL